MKNETEQRLKTGDVVYSKHNPEYLLIVKRQSGSSVYCIMADGLLSCEFVYEEKIFSAKLPAL